MVKAHFGQAKTRLLVAGSVWEQAASDAEDSEGPGEMTGSVPPTTGSVERQTGSDSGYRGVTVGSDRGHPGVTAGLGSQRSHGGHDWVSQRDPGGGGGGHRRWSMRGVMRAFSLELSH